MKLKQTALKSVSAMGLALALCGPASAEELGISFNIGATTDYVFRGFSQSAADPVAQGGLDVTYGMFYAGVWGSGIDFGTGAPNAEVDFYTGITPTFANINFDLGVIYYVYPNAPDAGAELDYLELKAGASTTVLEKLGIGATVYYSPEYTAKGGRVWTVEGTASYELPKIRGIVPSISGTVGTSISDNDPQFITAFSDDSYVYWNAGITLGVEKLSFDFRYWDTDVSKSGFCSGSTFQCDERFSFTAKFTY